MEDYELKSQILAAVDDLNQYLNGNVTGLGLIDTLKDTINYVEDYAMTIRESKDFDLRKYLAENKLLKENIDEGRMKDPSRSIKMGKYPQVSSDTPVPMNVKYLTTNGEKLTMKVQAKNRKEAVDAVKSKDSNFKAEIKTDFVYDKDGNKLLNEEIMVNPIIMFGGKEYIEGVLASPDDYGFWDEDAGWIKNNILTAPKMVSIQDYMALEDEWVKQAQIETGTGADRESVIDAIEVHVKQELITPEEGEEAKKIAFNF